ncbi:unnamed protein product, partial [Strongylus vulgaris]
VWDCDLEKQAHNWVAKCPTGPELSKGENFYRGPGVQVRILNFLSQSVTEWWKVFRSVDGPGASALYTSSHEGTRIDSYTQMAWAKTRYLGCSIARCGDDFVESCRYRVIGNTPGENMYETGRACTNCPTGSACNVGSPGYTADGLCG